MPAGNPAGYAQMPGPMQQTPAPMQQNTAGMQHQPPGGGMMLSPEEMSQMDINDPRAQAFRQQVYQPNQQVGQTLFARIDFLTPQEVQVLDTAITPENAAVFMKIFPELAPVIEQASALAAPPMQQPGGMMQPGMQPQMPGGQMGAPGGQMAAPAGQTPLHNVSMR